MALPKAVTSHHTAWVTAPGTGPHPVRYTVEGERLICFDDAGLANVPESTRVSVSIHEIAGGHLLSTFGASLRRLPPGTVAMSSVIDLLEHIPLGRTLAEVQVGLDDQRDHRRVIELTP